MKTSNPDVLEFRINSDGMWVAVDTIGKISINVLADKVKVYHERLECFPDLIDVLDYIETLTEKQIELVTEDNNV